MSASQPRPPATLRTSTGALPSILLVEDDLRLAELVSRYLESNGFTVNIASRGDEVVAVVEREPPDLVILDLGLPGGGWVHRLSAIAVELYQPHSHPDRPR